MAERTRTFTGVLPETGQEVLVHVFEEVPEMEDGYFPGGSRMPQILGVEVATREGDGRFARWSPPASMKEET